MTVQSPARAASRPDAPSRVLRDGKPYETLRSRVRSGEGADVVRLPVPAAAWIARLLHEDVGRPVLALVPGEVDVRSFLEGAELAADVPGAGVTSFPAPSLTPYQEAEASLSVRAQEVAALDRLTRGEASLLVTTPRALFRKLPTAGAFRRAVRVLGPDEEHPMEGLAEHLLRYGYRRTDLVSEVGDFAVRGGIFDVFPPGVDDPVRLDFFGDTVDSIRRFDRVSQRSEERLDEARLLPLSLFPAGSAAAVALADRLADEGRGRLSVEGQRRVEELRERGRFPGWENWLAALHDDDVTLFDLLPDAVVAAVDPPALLHEIEHHAEALDTDWTSRRTHKKPALAPDELEHTEDRVREILDAAVLRVRDLVTGVRDAEDAQVVDFAGVTTDLFHGQLPRFPQEVAAAKERGERVWVVLPESHRDRMRELLEARDLTVGPSGVELVAGDLDRGFRLPSAALSVYGETQLLPRAKLQRAARSPKARYGPFISSLRDLKVGDHIVHQDHGIGRFVGLSSLGQDDGGAAPLPPSLTGAREASAGKSEVMEIEYAGGKRLLLPLSRLDQIQNFSGIEGVHPRLDKLGGTSWSRTKSRVKKGLRDMAGELVKLYAARQVAEAPPMPPDSDLLHQFEAAFAYEETPDQLEAIAAVREDLEKERPMDRLLCGDVGYGKTEVAMRAAFKVVDGGYQVAVLAPTTILVDQHLTTFRKRLEGFPVNVEMVSRFRSAAEIRVIRKKLRAGEIDILIGTHRLLSKDLEIPKLGLLVVDEEQRFGVAQKERLKQIKKDVHVLAMSATPVPRTLQMSLAGVRDLSVIETPPKDRMAVETAILPFSRELIREAVEHEIERGGQVYYVYNRVESIERMQAYLREVAPGVRVTVGHGRLPEDELARRMHAFARKEYDVLLATTIIENGIDLPNVNTMLVHRADRFGLSQLYQLRGRVGRSDQLAYCYLLIPSDRVLSEQARKRLAAIREFTDLGAGFRIAARDLEIRGAGNLLGAEQSGHIAAVGIETYLKMLEDTIRELQGEEVDEGPSTAIDLPVPLSIPEEYVPDANLRMEMYRKIASGETSDDEILAELTDRFGTPPESVRSLLDVAALKRVAEGLRVQAVSAKGSTLTIRLRRDARVDVERLIGMVSRRPGATFSPTGVLTLEKVPSGELLDVAKGTLEELAA